MHILFCDDDRDLLEVLRLTLMPRGHTVETADSAGTAIALFEAHRAANCHYDLIVADQKMPGDSGYYLCGWVRAKGYTGRLAIMTAHEAESSNLAHVKAEYWKKPDVMAAGLLVELVEGKP